MGITRPNATNALAGFTTRQLPFLDLKHYPTFNYNSTLPLYLKTPPHQHPNVSATSPSLPTTTIPTTTTTPLHQQLIPCLSHTLPSKHTLLDQHHLHSPPPLLPHFTNNWFLACPALCPPNIHSFTNINLITLPTSLNKHSVPHAHNITLF